MNAIPPASPDPFPLQQCKRLRPSGQKEKGELLLTRTSPLPNLTGNHQVLLCPRTRTMSTPEGGCTTKGEDDDERKDILFSQQDRDRQRKGDGGRQKLRLNGGDGAGDGNRTRDVQLGKLAFCL